MPKTVPLLVAALVASTSFVGCSSQDQADDPEFEADWVEDYEQDLDEDTAEEQEQAQLDTVDDLDDVEVLDDETASPDDTLGTASVGATKKAIAPKRDPHGPLSIIQDDVSFSGASCAGTQTFDETKASERLDQAKALGADVVRVMVSWADTAPSPRALTKPDGFVSSKPDGYDWTEFDLKVHEARIRGMKVLVTISAGWMPYWASQEPGHCQVVGGAGCSWKPSTKEYAKWVTAIGRHARRAGLRIWAWSFVNAPNVDSYLSDDDPDAVARRYRQLWFAARKHLRKTAHTRARVLFGDVAASTRATASQMARLFNRVLCVERTDDDGVKGYCPHKHRRVWASGVAFHPYGANADELRDSLDYIVELTDRAYAADSLPKARGIYVTESGFLTARAKGEPGDGFVVTPDQQAVLMNQTDHVFWANKRVKTVAQYQLVDDGRGFWDSGLRFAKVAVVTKTNEVVTGDAVDTRRGDHVTLSTASGPRTIPWSEVALDSAGQPRIFPVDQGSPKPSYAAYRISIDVAHQGTDVQVFGVARADTGAGWTLEGQFATGWEEIKTANTDALGYGVLTVPQNGATAWRIRFGEELSRVAK